MSQGKLGVRPPANPITMEQYHAYAPEKFELWGGYLFLPEDYPDVRRQLLEAAQLAPEARWREALQRASDGAGG